MHPFDETFFQQPTVEIARALLGALLVRALPEGRLVGRIVEAEAYLYDDPACHGVRALPDGGTIHKRTRRNAAMFGPPGHAYVYFTYGNHFMFNVVTGPAGLPEAVLIRALEPLEGREIMEHNRRMRSTTPRPQWLTNGPGKLARAFAIDRALDGHDLAAPPLQLFRGGPVTEIVTTTRIGISRATDCPYRVYEKGNPWVSRK
ncbi:MAG TPA: DNA-3-methyladenine glycosylase [Armatimonadota bacterium]|nr:DNA-3-methyladenine glycosylase [Armatimonadota bacterium]